MVGRCVKKICDRLTKMKAGTHTQAKSSLMKEKEKECFRVVRYDNSILYNRCSFFFFTSFTQSSAALIYAFMCIHVFPSN